MLPCCSLVPLKALTSRCPLPSHPTSINPIVVNRRTAAGGERERNRTFWGGDGTPRPSRRKADKKSWLAPGTQAESREVVAAAALEVQTLPCDNGRNMAQVLHGQIPPSWEWGRGVSWGRTRWGFLYVHDTPWGRKYQMFGWGVQGGALWSSGYGGNKRRVNTPSNLPFGSAALCSASTQ